MKINLRKENLYGSWILKMAGKGYEDILEPRRNELNNWLWSTRSLKPQVAYKISPRPSPQFHKEAVLRSKKISELILEISRKQNVRKEEVEKQVMCILDEIGYTKSLKVLRGLAYALTKILLKVCSGLIVNYEGLLRIKSQMGSCPVIFVPTHRSYADFIIFSYVNFYFDIEIPAIAAGMDFHSMLGMGEMLRNTGAFFMRRSYNNDSLYWSTFKEYIHQLTCKGDLPIEFFIEGTRSRSNKSVAPKYGLINMILKSYFLREVPDILFVPVSINYDRVLEERLFAFELLGIPKPKESTSGFFKSLKILKENFGNIYVHFGEPISTRSFLKEKLPTSEHNFGPIHLHEINDEEKKVIPPLAYEIIRRQQTSSVISCFNLIALILNNNITRGQERTGLKELATEIAILRRTLVSWGATIFEQDLEESVKDCLLVHNNLICENNGAIGLITNKISVGELNPSKLKAHPLSEETIIHSVPFIMLQIYANPVLHYLVDAALIVIILRSPGKMAKDELFKHFCTLRALFSYEFVLLESWYKMHFEEALSRLTSENIITCRQDGQCDIFENNYFEEVLMSSIQPFILTYYVVTEMLLTLPEVVNEKTILSRVQMLLEEAINEKKIFIHPYCMSLDCLGNCLTSLTSMNIVTKSRQYKNTYGVNKDSIKRLKADLEIYIPSFHVIKSFDIFLHIKSKI